MSQVPPSAEEAARKAREIAAKLLGHTAPLATDSDSASAPASSTTSSGSKRKRWGVAPATTTTPTAATPTAVPALPGLDLVLAKKLKQESTEKVIKRVWITSSKISRERPAWHYVTYMTPKLHEIALAHQEGNDKLEIVFKGRGSSRQPALPGIPEEPLHVFIQGLPLQAENAETAVEQLLQEAEHAEVTVDITEEDTTVFDPTQALATASNSNDQLALIGGGGGHSSGSYRPATVAQLIGQNSAHHNGADAAYHIPQEDWPSQDIHVPNGVVGFIIGRGGETITSMQARTGAKVQIQKEHEVQPGQATRLITVSGPTMEAVEQCKTMITSMVEDRVRAAGGSSGGSSGFQRHNSSSSATNGNLPPKQAKVQQALEQGHCLTTVDVPDADTGLIIGKGGSTIQDIQGRTGASIQIPPAGNPDNPAIRTVSITHPTEAGAQEAATMITAILASKKNHVQHHNNNAMGGTLAASSAAQTTIHVMIPDKDVGLCIGRQGCVIREMQNKTRTRIQIPGHPTPGQPHRIATVSGTPEACEQVRQMIERIVVEQSSACVMAGTNAGGGGAPGAGYYNQQQANNQQYQQGGGYHGQQQQAQQPGAGGQQDYSAEWAAYYAAQQQVAQQQQQQQAPVVVAPTPAPAPVVAPAAAAPAPGPAADAYYEEFFRYAYYYGEPAARQYYGAWSPPPGTSNPYGVNPDGVTVPPATGAATPAAAATAAAAPVAAAPAPAPSQPEASQGPARETSVRKVSNLPAWMTRGQQ